MKAFEYWVTVTLGGGVIGSLLIRGVNAFAVCDTTGKKHSYSAHLPNEVRGARKWGWELRTSSSSCGDSDKEDDIPMVRGID